MRTISTVLCVLLLPAVALAVFTGCSDQTATVSEAESVPAASAEEAESAGAALAPGLGVEKEQPAESQPEPEPESEYVDYTWEFDTPENHGVDAAALERFHSALGGVDIRSFLLVRDGVIIDEYYKDGYDESSVFGFASCTKSISGALIGLAINEGLIESVDVTPPEFFPQLEGTDKENITVGHLLGHVSGIYWREWAGGDYFGRLSRSDNWVDFVLGQEMEAEPGTFFNYTTGGSHLLGAIIQEASGETAFDFAVERLFKPLGMRSVKWRHDPQGITDGGNGISMTARDAAKFGQLYLNGGEWNGAQVIPADWARESVEYQFAGSPNTGTYGYSWWRRTYGGHEAYYAMGHGGQYIIVMPGLELVAVFSSRLNDTYVPQYMFDQYIVPNISTTIG